MLTTKEYMKNKEIKDIGHIFMKPAATRGKVPGSFEGREFVVQMLLPDEPVIYELFITALAVYFKVTKQEVFRSLWEYWKNMRKYGEFRDISERTLAIVAENLLDDHDVYAIKQDPEAVVDIYIGFLKKNANDTFMPMKDILEREKSLKELIPKFLKTNKDLN